METMIILLIMGTVVLYLSHRKEKADLIYSFFAGFLFLFAGMIGLTSQGQQTGEIISYEYITYNTDTVIQSTSSQPIFEENNIFNKVIPTMCVLFSIYLFVGAGLDGKTR